MARTLTTDARTKAEARAGVEAFVVLEIQWGSPVGTRYFGDKDTTIGSFAVDGRILSLSPIRSQIGVDDRGSASILTVELSDSDQVLRGLLDQAPIEHRAVRVLHHFEGLGEADLVELLNGVVSSPVSWEEDGRTLTFDVEGRANSQSACYVPASGDFSSLHADGVGQVWPVVFGTVIDVPAALVERAPLGRLAEDVGMDAITFEVLEAEDFPVGTTITLHVSDEYISGQFMALQNEAADAVKTFTIIGRNEDKYSSIAFGDRPLGDPDVADGHYAWLADSASRVVGLYMIIDASDVPGSVTTPKYNFVIAQEGAKVRFQWPWSSGLLATWLLTATSPANGADVRAYVNDGDYRILEAGSPVTIQGDEEDVFVANEIASTDVLRVRAWKTVQYNRKGAEQEVLVDVPEEYYSVVLADAGLGAPDGRLPTTITFPIRLSERGRWRDSVVYVSLVSSVGSNTSDVIAWLLTTYTDLTPDPTSFAVVAAALTNYPSHFYLGGDLGQVDAIQAAAEIAWQARCGLYTVGQSAFLRYLSEEPSSTDAAVTLDDAADNVKEASVRIVNTDLEDVVTVLQAEWRPEGSATWRDLPHENNVEAYGRRERRFRFWIYQTEDLVAKSAAFWSGRYSRVWRRMALTAFLDALGLDVLDSVTVDLAGLGLPSVIGRVSELAHDTEQNLVDVLLWLPIEAGAVVQSSAAYVDDSGDVAPADPSVDVSPAPAELEVVEASQRGTTFLSVESAASTPAKVTQDLGGGNYQAVTYPEGLAGSPSDTIVVGQVGDTDLTVDDEIMAQPSKAGAWYATKGGGAAATVKVGIVSSGSGLGPYVVAIYDNGLDQVSTEAVAAYPMDIAVGYSFPTGLRVFLTFVPGADSGNGRWYFQGPVWIDS